MRKLFLISIAVFISLGSIFTYQFFVFQDQKLHIVFCDVGQGDAIFIKTPDDLDILVDGGPNDSVLSCLAEHMPFWDKTLELVILTHPHADHLNGLISVAKNYTIITFATENLKNKTQGFAKLINLIQDQDVKVKYVYAGDKFKLKDGVVVEIAGPTKEYLQVTSPGGDIRESGEFASVLSLIKYKDFEVLLAGDSQVSGLEEAIRDSQVGDIDVLQAPHHGSKTGLNSEILDTLRPELAVISVGAKNKYNHPNPLTLQLLKDKQINILRTNERGDIEIFSDGEKWGVRN